MLYFVIEPNKIYLEHLFGSFDFDPESDEEDIDDEEA